MGIKEHILRSYEIQTIKDIALHGCISGIASDLIYYDDTVKFHDEHEDEIWDLLHEDSESQGCTTMELIAQFNGQKDIDSMQQFKNILTWYAVEQICFQIINSIENEEN